MSWMDLNESKMTVFGRFWMSANSKFAKNLDILALKHFWRNRSKPLNNLIFPAARPRHESRGSRTRTGLRPSKMSLFGHVFSPFFHDLAGPAILVQIPLLLSRLPDPSGQVGPDPSRTCQKEVIFGPLLEQKVGPRSLKCHFLEGPGHPK